ncbi:hypothetical protein CFOL_v3_00337 [Cephalotus follicularis]|uniref:Uncharacterized protein n=1 Tax=Cephalotus follicularis TaxID=3775 RepID=A0A1Q3AME0_CEPFO|nr:hypothetical protein CFOL_v3_00337 [Cephalotus follicularis]
MSNPRKQEFINDHIDPSNGGGGSDDFADSSSVVSSSTFSGVETSSGRESGLTERLTDFHVDGDGDGDLLLQRSGREDKLLQWLQALDMQFMGACRADERLKPLLKYNASSGVAEDRLLAHLSQHFEPSEVGMLARCFCIPLVSIRVGKVTKQGTVLCPTATRGNLSLTLLPTSHLRLSFIGDDGRTERLFTFSSNFHCSAVAITEIPADTSGRSFLVKIPNGRVFYFWCSEKSKLLGIELLSKMKDLIGRKPSIAELTGISESRLGCFATHLRAYLVGSAVNNNKQESSAGSPIASSDSVPDPSDMTHNAQCSSTSSKSLRSRHTGTQAMRTNSLYQGILSPRSSSFKEGLPKTLSSLRNAAREKLRRRGDCYLLVDDLAIASPIVADASSSNHSENDKLPDVKSCPLSFPESLGKFTTTTFQVTSLGPPCFSPHYCWCPPGSSTLQDTTASLQHPTLTAESPVLPPLSSLLSANRSTSLWMPTPPLNLADLPSLDFPAFIPDPLVRLPIPTSQQILTFTPLMCDPIVHVPFIDVCSSGQGYLVSAGPTLSSTIPLHPKLVKPLLPETDSVVEKGARETLRRLLISGSSQTNSPLLDVLPTVLTNNDEKQSMLVTGSRGFYGGTRDVGAIANSIAAMSLVSLSGNPVGDRVVKERGGCDILDVHTDGYVSEESCSNDGGYRFANLEEERTE